MMRAPVVVVPCSSKAAYLGRYAEPDKGWTDRDEARWPVPFWHMDAAMASLLILQTAVDAGLGGCFFGIPPAKVAAVRAEFAIARGVRPGRRDHPGPSGTAGRRGRLPRSPPSQGPRGRRPPRARGAPGALRSDMRTSLSDPPAWRQREKDPNRLAFETRAFGLAGFGGGTFRSDRGNNQSEGRQDMVVLGLILLIIGLVASISILTTIGAILLVVGLILNLVPIGGTRRRVF